MANINLEDDIIKNNKELYNRILGAITIAEDYGGIDGGHHKTWVIDQMVRILLGEKYETFVKEYCDGEDGPNTYEWEEGIAP